MQDMSLKKVKEEIYEYVNTFKSILFKQGFGDSYVSMCHNSIGCATKFTGSQPDRTDSHVGLAGSWGFLHL
jgi:hypothetical protein